MPLGQITRRRDIESTGSLGEPLLRTSSSNLKLASTTCSTCGNDVPMSLEDAIERPSSRRETTWLLIATILLVTIAVIELAVAVPVLLNASGSAAAAAGSWGLPLWRSYPRFFVLGDWGRDGDYNQTVVAAAMARKAASFRPDFIISTGDNFYEAGLVSPQDPQFDTSFTEIYNQRELINVPWHAVLGNHDYGELKDGDRSHRPPGCDSLTAVGKRGGDADCFYGPAHQLDVALTARDPRWHCERFFSLSAAAGDVDLLFIDTTPLVRSYADETWASNRGGVLQQSPEDQLRELEARLASSTAAWKVVVGHHPIRTNHRPDGNFKDMVADVEPLLIKYGAQIYFAGHDHNLQYLHDPETQYHHVTSGAGSDTGSSFYGDKHSPFQWGGNGFVAVTMGRKSTRVEFMGVDGAEPLYTVDIPKEPAQHR